MLLTFILVKYVKQVPAHNLLPDMNSRLRILQQPYGQALNHKSKQLLVLRQQCSSHTYTGHIHVHVSAASFV